MFGSTDPILRDRYRFRKEIRDPRTNQDMDYDMAITHHYVDSISILDLQNVIHRRIPYLTIVSMEEFNPPNHRRCRFCAAHDVVIQKKERVNTDSFSTSAE